MCNASEKILKLQKILKLKSKKLILKHFCKIKMHPQFKHFIILSNQYCAYKFFAKNSEKQHNIK